MVQPNRRHVEPANPLSQVGQCVWFEPRGRQGGHVQPRRGLGEERTQHFDHGQEDARVLTLVGVPGDLQVPCRGFEVVQHEQQVRGAECADQFDTRQHPCGVGGDALGVGTWARSASWRVDPSDEADNAGEARGVRPVVDGNTDGADNRGAERLRHRCIEALQKGQQCEWRSDPAQGKSGAGLQCACRSQGGTAVRIRQVKEFLDSILQGLGQTRADLV